MSHDDTAERLSAAKARIEELEAAALTEAEKDVLLMAARCQCRRLRHYSADLFASPADRSKMAADSVLLAEVIACKLRANP